MTLPGWGLKASPIIKLTFSEMLASSPDESSQVYVTDSTVKDIFTYDGTEWKSFGYKIFNNDEGSAVAAGDVVVISASTDFSVQLTTTKGDTSVSGICVIGGADDTDILVKTHGTAMANKNTSTVFARDSLVICSTVKGEVDVITVPIGSELNFAMTLETTLSSDPQVTVYMAGKEIV